MSCHRDKDQRWPLRPKDRLPILHNFRGSCPCGPGIRPLPKAPSSCTTHSPPPTGPGERRAGELRARRGVTASLKVGTHCQTTAPAFRRCLPLSLSLRPSFFEDLRPSPPPQKKIKHNQYKRIYKSDPRSSTQLSI